MYSKSTIGKWTKSMDIRWSDRSLALKPTNSRRVLCQGQFDLYQSPIVRRHKFNGGLTPIDLR